MIHLPISNNIEAKKAINDLIDNTMLPDDLVEEDKGFLFRDPTFQSRCHALYLRAIGKLPKLALIPLPESVQKTINPFPLNAEAKDALNKISQLFPFVEPEKKDDSPKKLPKTSQSNDYRHLAKANMYNPPPIQVKKIKINENNEINDIINLVNMNYENVFSEEMLS